MRKGLAMKSYWALLLLVALPLAGDVAVNPHPDPDRPRIYTQNYHWRAQPELAEALRQQSRLAIRPEVEKLVGCMDALDYLVTPAVGEERVRLDLSSFNGLEYGELIVIAKGALEITAFPQSPPEGKGRATGQAIEKRILPGKELFTVQVSGQVQSRYFSFYNASSRELLAFPIQEKVTLLRLSFHPDDAVFDWRILERFPNLNWLEIEGATELRNAKEFRGNLRTLVLRGCRNLDLPPLEPWGLVFENCELRPELLERLRPGKLSWLEIEDTELADVAFLKRFAECINLKLSRWPNLRDISPLAEMKELRSLTLYETAVADVAPLARLEELSGLELNGNRVEDLSPLEGRNFDRFSFSGSDRAVSGKFAEKEFSSYKLLHPQMIERDGHRWRLTLDGKRVGNAFQPNSAMLTREDYPALSHFRLDHRSGRYEYPPSGLGKWIYLPKQEGKTYTIAIEGAQRFTDFIRVDSKGVTLTCREGELVGAF